MLLVAGPSCGGKTTYVRRVAPEGARILDFGDLLEEFGEDRYAADDEAKAKARKVWVERLPLSDYVVWGAPRREDRGRFRRQYGARVVVVVAPLYVCLERAKRERPEGWDAYVVAWYGAYRPSLSGGEEIVWTG